LTFDFRFAVLATFVVLNLSECQNYPNIYYVC
jgi:hypothetical protein